VNFNDLLIAVFSPGGIRVMITVLIGGAAIAIGAGYRVLGKSMALASVAGLIVGGLSFLLLFPAFLLFGGRGEGSGIFAFIGAMVFAGCAGVIFAAAALLWIARRSGGVFRRERPMVPAALIGAIILLVGIVPAFTGVFGLQSNASLARDVAQAINQPLAAEATETLKRRGQEGVEALITILRQSDRARMREFESGLTQGTQNVLRLLGQLGGNDAIAELRLWLNSDYAPDVRAAAARGLGEAHDLDSAEAIGKLLELDTYEWRKVRLDLIYALNLMKAQDQVSRIAAAVRLPAEDATSSFASELMRVAIQALVSIDTPEAWKAIEGLQAGADANQKENIQRTLENLGRETSIVEKPV
jgi:hypothetical protein